MYTLLGFFLAAYLKVPILGVAIVGLVAAAILYTNLVKAQNQRVVVTSSGEASATDDKGMIEDDE